MNALPKAQFTPEVLSKLSARDLKLLIWRQKWLMTARPNQLPQDELEWTEWILGAGRGFGKAVPIDMPIPTPTGWKTMDALQIGDQVFDETGSPCIVRATHEVPDPETAYRLTFSDNTTIDCCGDHQWVTWTHRDRKEYFRANPGITEFPENWPTYRQVLPRYLDVVGPQIRTTRQIVDTLTFGKRNDTNHCIPTAGALRYETKALSLDPWLLGYWLGNGALSGGQVSCHKDDTGAVRQRFEALGFSCQPLKSKPQDFYASGLIQILRQIGVLGNKHAPSNYLQGDIAQRTALLAGLLDSDGHCALDSGHIEFCSIDRPLADAVMELARSLGQKPILGIGRATFRGVDHGAKYRVTWRPTFNPFSLSRKASAVQVLGSQGIRNQHRMIVKAEPIPAVPMRCIEVDSPNHMYLVGDGMIPTHNTLAGAQWLGYEAITDKQALPSFVIAPTLNDVRYTCFEGPTGILSLMPPEVIKDYNKTNLIITLDNGAVIRGFSAEEPERLRGPQCGRGWLEELGAWGASDQDTFDMFMMGLRLGPRPRFVCTTTPKPRELVRKLFEPKTNRVLVHGTTYENRANLPQSFFDQLVQYEGTQLGRQELEGELIDAEEGGVIQRSWLRLWPHDKPLPSFDWIIMSLDTAFTERVLDRKSHDPDPTACGVWGVFWHEDLTHIMLLDAWEDHLSFPDLIKRVKQEKEVRYGDDHDRPMLKPMFGPARATQGVLSGRKPDIILIEEKGSGISLIQSLEREGIDTYRYNPGNADKLTRLHMVSHVFAKKRVWAPESENPKRKGRPKTWCDTLITQLCSYRGPNSIRHDDHVDQTTQAVKLAIDKGMISDIKRTLDARRKDEDAPPPRKRGNPYAA